jgi:molybdopterin-guanine dinucleotide biosynthesis protein A
MDSLIGIILCGGKSSRMGQDKGMLKLGKDTWAEIAYSKLKFFSIPVYVSINKNQEVAYNQCFQKSILIEDDFPVGGPLKGILSAHHKFPEKDLLILSCDMPLMNLSVLYRLFDNYLFFKTKFDFFSYSLNERFEPLCSIYTSSGLKNIETECLENKLRENSPQALLKSGNTKILTVPSGSEEYFTNFNYPSQVELKLKENVKLEVY